MRERKQSDRGVKPKIQTIEANPRILTKKQRLELLSDYAKAGNAKFVNPVEAMKEITKILGEYAPLQVNIDKRIVFEVEFKDMTLIDNVVEEFPTVENPTDRLKSDVVMLSEGTDEPSG